MCYITFVDNLTQIVRLFGFVWTLELITVVEIYI